MKALYGRGPLHLVGHLLLFVLAGYAIAQLTGIREARYAFAWLIGAVLLHDVVLWPLYTVADRAGTRRLGRWINHVRIPAGLSLVTLLAFFPIIASRGEGNYLRVAGIGWSGYLLRWLIVTAALFAVSALVYLVRRRSAPGGSKS
jgi:hypothetical protein